MQFELGSSLLSVVVGIVGLLIRRAIKTPSDAQRAALIATLADDAAAVILDIAPNLPWAQMVADVVGMLRRETTTPTGNTEVLRRAAIGALARLGKKAPAEKKPVADKR